jgi:SnoaL-like domain
MTEISMQHMADELAIGRVLAEYCLRLEISAFDEWLDLFTEDSIYVVMRRTLTGRAEISDMLSQAPHGVHLPGASRISINGDSAEVIQSYLFFANSNDSWNSGWYDRTLVRTEQGWKIARTVVKMARSGDLSPNVKANGLTFPVSYV